MLIGISGCGSSSKREKKERMIRTYYARLNVLLLSIVLASCMAGSRETKSDEPLSIPAVHHRYLKYPVPSAGIDVEFNPPVLRWPVQSGGPVTYDVRLCTDASFRAHVLEKKSLPWAMFNPHEKLSEGTWYWQYRPAGGDWSPVEQFYVPAGAVDLVSPPASRLLRGIPDVHPRVLAVKSELQDFRISPHDADVSAILEEANAAMMGRILTEADGKAKRETQDEAQNRKFRQDASQRLGDFVYRTVLPLCQGYLLTGDERFRERALSIIFEVAKWDPEGVTGSAVSDFSDARCMLAMSIAFDTFYDGLSSTQRDILVKAVHARAHKFYLSWINNQEARLLSGHVWQHILHYLFQTALAMYGEDPAATDWLTYSYELFLARTPILGGTDGGWTEGVSYFRMNMETVIEIPLFIHKYTGFDFIRSHPWYTRNIDWLIYNIPPGSSADGFGDNTEEIFSPGAEYVAYAKELARLTGSQQAAWYARQCELYENVDLSSTRTLRWIRLVRTRHLSLPDPETDLDLRMGRLFRDIGLVSMHSDPQHTDLNLMVALRSSPFGCYGHFLSDQNAFNIVYGGKRTFFRTGYKVTMNDPHRTGWYQHTKSNNSVLVDGEGQPYSTEAFGWIAGFLEGRDLAYALGDASNAYRSAETREDYKVKKFYRHLVLLKPDIVVIYDELESHGDVKWSWLIHSMEKIDLNPNENTFKSVFDHARGIGKLWSSRPVNWLLADTFDVPAVNWRASRDPSGNLKKYDDGQWHLQAVSRSKDSTMRFLAVLQISPEASEENISEVDEGTSVNVQAGDWTISADLGARTRPSFTIKNKSGTTLMYEGSGDPVLIEVTGGTEKRTEARLRMPWHLKQSWLHHSRETKTIQQHE